jgi:hypothetical protein
MVNLVFLGGLDIDPCSCDEYGEWISDELYTVLSAEDTGEENVVVAYCGELNESVITGE